MNENNNLALRRILRPKVALRLLGICFLGCLSGILLFNTPYWLAAVWSALGTIALFYETIRFVDQSERKLSAFLQSLNQRDFSVTFSENSRSPHYDLHRAFNELNGTYKKLRSDKESEHHLLHIIVEHAAVPMICFDEDSGEISLANQAVYKLFQQPFIHTIDSLTKVDAGLPGFMREAHNDEKSSLRLSIHGRSVFLTVTSRYITFHNRNLKLVAFYDVSSELAAKEAETWHRLLRVLTHEISNSAIPLSTLSAYIFEMMTVAEAENRMLTRDEKTDLMESLKTIDRRSKSLKEFVQNFQSLNRVPEPRLAKVDIMEMVNEALQLFGKELIKEGVAAKVTGKGEGLLVYADRGLTMQVLINLIKNAVEAMKNYKENKFLELALEQMGDRYVQLHIIDNGQGIEPEALDQIFIPFFTTKKTGSGIGLSISQQIMQRQRGDISVRSEVGKGSVFTMSFSC